MKPAPRPHQIEALQDIINGNRGILHNDRAQFISACGTGKTLTSMWANTLYLSKAKNLMLVDNQTLSVFMYPSLALIAQSYGSFAKLLGKDFKPLIVCSEQKIGQPTGDVDDMVDSDFNYPTCTSSGIVADYLSDKRIGLRTIMVTYQSAAVVAEALKITGITADITFYDEAHKTAQGSDGMMSFSLSDDNFPSKKRLFMTATPRHSSLDTEEMEFTMDNEAVYGKVTHELSMRKAIDLGLIADYQVIGGLTEVDIDSSNPDEVLVANIEAMVKAIKEESSKKVMLFSGSIETSKAITAYINDRHGHFIEAMHIDGSMSHADRESAISFLHKNSNRVRVLSNSKILGEGVDVPSVDMVGLLSGKSEKDIIQRTGRVQRLEYDGQHKIGKVFVPIIMNKNGAIVSGEEQLLSTLLSLRENDENLRTTMLSSSWSSVGAMPGVKLTNFEAQTSVHISSVFAHLHRGIQSVVLGGHFEAKWHEKYNALLEFINKHDRLPSSTSMDPMEKSLGLWCGTQKSINNKGELSDERRVLLEKIPGFFKGLNDVWVETCEAVKKFIEEYKRNPYKESKDPEEARLGAWRSGQMVKSNKGELSDERRVLLEKIPGFFRTVTDKWDEAYSAVAEFVDNFNKTPSTISEDPKERKLARWCSNQRQNNKNGALSDERRVLLEKIPGFFKGWAGVWQETYNEVVEFLNKQKRSPELSSENPEEARLGRWCATQRKNSKKGNLSDEQKELLDRIPNFFKGLEDIWRETYELVVEFYKTNNKTPSSTSKNAEETRLGLWCVTQRKNYKNGTLSDERRVLLEKIPGIFDDRNNLWREAWRETHKLFVEFCQKNNRTPSAKSKDAEEARLGRWYYDQRKIYKRGVLLKDHREMLEKIPGFFKDINSQQLSIAASTEEENIFGNNSEDQEDESISGLKRKF